MKVDIAQNDDTGRYLDDTRFRFWPSRANASENKMKSAATGSNSRFGRLQPSAPVRVIVLRGIGPIRGQSAVNFLLFRTWNVKKSVTIFVDDHRRPGDPGSRTTDLVTEPVLGVFYLKEELNAGKCNQQNERSRH
jgi:hypothetical protein